MIKERNPINDKFNLPNYTIFQTRSLGEGVFGDVYVGVKKSQPQKEYAIKIINFFELSSNNQDIQNFGQRQIIFGKEHNHYHIIKIIDYYFSKQNIFIVQQKCDYDLRLLIKAKNKMKVKLTGNQYFKILYQICEGFKYLNYKGFTQRNLKPENILIKNGIIKIADYGTMEAAQRKKESMMRIFNRCDHLYTPPQLICEQQNQSRYDQKIEVWCFGCIAYELFIGQLPWTESNLEEKKQFFKENVSLKVEDIQLMRINKGTQKQILTLLNLTLVIDYQKRSNWKEVIEYFEEYVQKSAFNFPNINAYNNDFKKLIDNYNEHQQYKNRNPTETYYKKYYISSNTNRENPNNIQMNKIIIGEEQLQIKAQRLFKIAQNFYYKLRYNEALSNFNSVIEIYNQINKQNSIQAAKTFYYIGITYFNMHKYDYSLNYYSKALQIYRKNEKKNIIQIGTVLNNIGFVFNNQNKYDDSLDYFNQAYQIFTNKYGQISIQAANIITNIAFVYNNVPKYNQSLVFFNKSLEIYAKINGQNSIQEAYMLKNIGLVYKNRSQYETSLVYSKKALQIYKQNNKQDLIEVANLLFEIGKIYNILSKYEESISFLYRAFQVYAKNNKQNSVQTVNILQNISLVYKNQNNQEQSFKLQQKVYVVREQILGIKNYQIIKSKTMLQKIDSRINQKLEFNSYHIQNNPEIDTNSVYVFNYKLQIQ